jgi:NAD dependent epimerase/dehydratase family enzyme
MGSSKQPLPPSPTKTFAKVQGKAFKRPALIHMPAFLLKLMMGQMAEELPLSGQRVMPQKMPRCRV